tara:strand:+ start:554 stop:1255 length:702 start_codon:yes stop_codon:yes gene_type:complete
MVSKKWIFGGLGWAFGGPLGALFGYGIGSMFDNKQKVSNGTDFELALLSLAAVIIKADGVIKKEELNCVKAFFIKSFGQYKADMYFKIFNDIKNKPFPSVRSICLQIDKNVNHSGRLIIVQFLFSIAASDNELLDIEINLIKKISKYLHINDYDFESIKSMFLENGSSIDNDYKILEISKNSTIDEIKKAYRKMAKKYHPDKLQGVSDDIIKMAEEKFNKVNQAYERIMKSRK